MKMKFIICVPVNMEPRLPEIAKDSIYEEQECPICKELMWVGERSKAFLESHTGSQMLCAVCAIKHLGVTKETQIKTLSKMEEFNG